MRTLRTWLLSALLVVIPASLFAANVSLRSDHPEEYTVKRGDTLWDISGKFLRDPWYWPEIWHVNPQIQNPHLIYPGDRLRLIWVDGKPRLTLQRGPGGTYKLTPEKRIIPLDQAIPAIPLDIINSFLNGNRIVDLAEMDAAPYVLTGEDERVISGAGDIVYARGSLDQELPSYGIYRMGQLFVDPDTGENLGYEAREIGRGVLEDVERDIIKLRLSKSREEVVADDRLLSSAGSRVDSVFHPRAPQDPVSGKIIAVSSGVSQVGPYNVVTINRGSREGMQVGDVLAIYKTGAVVRDHRREDRVQLPAERGGEMMVFRVFEKISYGLVMRATRPLAVLDEVRNP